MVLYMWTCKFVSVLNENEEIVFEESQFVSGSLTVPFPVYFGQLHPDPSTYLLRNKLDNELMLIR